MKMLVVLNNNACNNDNNKKLDILKILPIVQHYLSPNGAILSKIFDSIYSGQFA